MEPTYGQRLQAARKRAKIRSQKALGDIVGVSGRTIRDYEIDKRPPPPEMREKLRAAVGSAFDDAGDEVEMAIKASRLTEDRQYAVLSVYKRELREQDAARTG